MTTQTNMRNEARYLRNECSYVAQEQMNRKLYDRNIPSKMLQPYLDVRPVMTKYSYFPIVDPRAEIHVKMRQMPTYNVHKTFNPGTNVAPWSGFATNINTESELRNQIYALQKCSQADYVPKSSSDLYNYSFQTVTQPNPHELLFQTNSFNSFNPNPNEKIVGGDMFMNSTRAQLKNMTKESN
jgi:hypothetical protein